jgi:hypothetical protein
MPGGAWEFFLIIAVPIAAFKMRNSRAISIFFCTSIALVGSIIVFTAPFDNKAALLAGYYLVSRFADKQTLDSELTDYNLDILRVCRLYCPFVPSSKQHCWAHEESVGERNDPRRLLHRQVGPVSRDQLSLFADASIVSSVLSSS